MSIKRDEVILDKFSIDWSFINSIIQSSVWILIGALLKFIWDFFALKRNEKMFYSNEILKLQSEKLDKFINTLASFHRYLVEVQFLSLLINPVTITETNTKLLACIAEIDNALVEFSFFVNDARYNALRDNYQSIINLLDSLSQVIGNVALNGYTQVNRDNFGVIIHNLDLIIYSAKKNLSEIMPGEYKFNKIGKFARFEPASTENNQVD